MKVLIVEDEIIAAKRLIRLLLEIDPEINIAETIGTVIDSVNYLQDNRLDLIFMDIQLADGISFEIFEHMEMHTPIIFITAYDEYMQKAFKVNSIDYLLKPIDKSELEYSLRQFHRYRANNLRSIDNVHLLIKELSAKRSSFKKRFLARKGNGFISIDVMDIAYILSANKLIYLVLVDSKRYVVDYSLDNILEKLDPADFFKINRNYIISSKSIIKMQSYFNNRMILELNPTTTDAVMVSRNYLADFKKWLDM